jgi:hypothetical protein
MVQNVQIRDDIATCWNECGIRTRRPYMIDGHPFCPDCAAQIDPAMVRERTIAEMRAWNDGTWKSNSPGGPGHSRRPG